MRFSLAFLTVVITSVSALAVTTGEDKVYDGEGAHTLLAWFPPITRPAGGESYSAGSTQIAAWNRALPTGYNLTQVGKHADLLLGYTVPNELNYHLDVTLVKNISLYEGDAEVEYTLPSDLPTRDSYFLALIGSSSNISPKFTITGTTAAPEGDEAKNPVESEEDEPEFESHRKRSKLLKRSAASKRSDIKFPYLWQDPNDTDMQ